MNAISARRATVFLRRGALLAGLLAIVAGILGMHIMTGPHAMPAAATGQDSGTLHAMPTSEHPDHAADITAVADIIAVPGITAAPGITHAPGPSCSDSGGCTMISAMDGNCVPSPGTTTLAAPSPGTTPLPFSGGPVPGVSNAGYGFIPRSPSPGQLSISRT